MNFGSAFVPPHFALWVCAALLAGQSTAQDTLLLDGANEAVIAATPWHSSPHPLRFPAIPSFHEDLDRYQPPPPDGSPLHLFGWLDLGAETGEPLFARIVDGVGGNREHITNAGAAASIGPLSFSGGYRHTGNYTDRYQAFWAAYARRHGWTSPYSHLGEHGLANYYFGTWRLEGERVNARGYATRYEHWQATPYFFSPLLRKGVRVEQECSGRLGPYGLAARVGMDTEDRFLDHRTPADYAHRWGSCDATRDVGGRLTAGLGLSFASRAVPGIAATASLMDTAEGPLRWRVRLGSYEDRSGFGSLMLLLGDGRELTLALRAALDFAPKQRDYHFVTVHDTIDYSSSAYYTLRLRSALSWPGKEKVPLSVELWADHDHRPPWEWIDTIARENRIERRPADMPISRLGAVATYRYAIGPLALEPYARGHVAAGGRAEPLFLPWSAGLHLSAGKPAGGMPGARITFEAVGPVRAAYRSGTAGEIETHAIPERFALSGECRVPFILPSWAGMLSPVFHVRVSRVHLFGPVRRKLHPLGSVMGPVIVCTLEAAVRVSENADFRLNSAD